MRRFIKRQFLAYDFKYQEKWLNDKAKEGLSLIAVTTDACIPRYEFDETEKDLYKIAVFLLDKKAITAEGKEQIKIIEQTGAEYVGAYEKWVFFRRKSELGDFNTPIYNEIQVKSISHIIKSYLPYIIISYIILLANFFVFTKAHNPANIIMGVLLLAITVYDTIKILKLHKKQKHMLEG